MRDGLNGFLALIASTIKTSRPRFMVIDGFRSAREFSSTELELSQFIHELSAFVTAAGCTTLILAPLSGNEPHPEHTLVDGLIELNRFPPACGARGKSKCTSCARRDHLLGSTSSRSPPTGSSRSHASKRARRCWKARRT